MAYDNSIDYSKKIQEAIASGDNSAIEDLAVARLEKINADPKLKQYANDVYSQLGNKVLEQRATAAKMAQANDMQTLITQRADAQRAAATAGFDSARQSALSGLTAEQGAIAPKYEEGRRILGAQQAQQARNFQEFEASRGGATSGTAAQSDIALRSATQRGVGTLASQEAGAYTDIERRKSDVNTQYELARQQALAGIDAETSGQLISQKNADRQYGLQESQYKSGLAQWQTEFNQNKANADRTYEMAVSQMDEGTRRWDIENAFNVRQQTFAESQAKIQNAISRGNLSVAQGNLLLAKNRANADADPSSLDNLIKIANATGIMPPELAKMTEGGTVIGTPGAEKPINQLDTMDVQKEINAMLNSQIEPIAPEYALDLLGQYRANGTMSEEAIEWVIASSPKLYKHALSLGWEASK
jgi:hypothetical protein